MTERIVEAPAPGVALVRLSRPEALNALNMAVRRHLAEIFARLSAVADVRCIVVAGNERAFAAALCSASR